MTYSQLGQSKMKTLMYVFSRRRYAGIISMLVTLSFLYMLNLSSEQIFSQNHHTMRKVNNVTSGARNETIYVISAISGHTMEAKVIPRLFNVLSSVRNIHWVVVVPGSIIPNLFPEVKRKAKFPLDVIIAPEVKVNLPEVKTKVKLINKALDFLRSGFTQKDNVDVEGIVYVINHKCVYTPRFFQRLRALSSEVGLLQQPHSTTSTSRQSGENRNKLKNSTIAVKLLKDNITLTCSSLVVKLNVFINNPLIKFKESLSTEQLIVKDFLDQCHVDDNVQTIETKDLILYSTVR